MMLVVLANVCTETKCAISIKVELPSKKELRKMEQIIEHEAENAREQREREVKEAAAYAALAQRLAERTERLDALRTAKEDNAQQRKECHERFRVFESSRGRSGSAVIEKGVGPGEVDEDKAWNEVYKKCAYGGLVVVGGYMIAQLLSAHF